MGILSPHDCIGICRHKVFRAVDDLMTRAFYEQSDFNTVVEMHGIPRLVQFIFGYIVAVGRWIVLQWE